MRRRFPAASRSRGVRDGIDRPDRAAPPVDPTERVLLMRPRWKAERVWTEAPTRLTEGEDGGSSRAMPGADRPLLAVLVRGTGFLAFWLVLIGVDVGSLAVGLVTAAAATWTSLHLLPA